MIIGNLYTAWYKLDIHHSDCPYVLLGGGMLLYGVMWCDATMFHILLWDLTSSSFLSSSNYFVAWLLYILYYPFLSYVFFYLDGWLVGWVVYTLYYISTHTIYYILCTMHYILHTMYNVLYFTSYALYLTRPTNATASYRSPSSSSSSSSASPSSFFGIGVGGGNSNSNSASKGVKNPTRDGYGSARYDIGHCLC